MADAKPKRVVTQMAREKMAESARTRHARDRAARLKVADPDDKDCVAQAMLDKLQLPYGNETVRDIVDAYVNLLDAPGAYAVYMLRNSEVRKQLSQMFAKPSLGDPTRLKALALLADLAKNELALAKDLGLLDPESAARKQVQQLVQIVLNNTPPEVRQQLADEIKRNAVLYGSVA